MGKYKRLFMHDVILELKIERRVDIYPEGSAQGSPFLEMRRGTA